MRGDWNGQLFIDLDLSTEYDTIINPEILPAPEAKLDKQVRPILSLIVIGS